MFKKVEWNPHIGTSNRKDFKIKMQTFKWTASEVIDKKFKEPIKCYLNETMTIINDNKNVLKHKVLKINNPKVTQ